MSIAEEIAFDYYRIDLKRRRLLREGEPVVLSGKAFDLLAIFVSSDGAMLTREQLYERLWPTTIVEDANLSQTVYLLRRALDPAGDGRTFIETVARVGYRFAKGTRAVTPVRERPAYRFSYATFAALCFVLIGAALWPLRAPHGTIPMAARNADALGQYHLDLRSPDHLAYALAYFKEAERRAPGGAEGYAGAAAAYSLLAEFQPEGSSRQRNLVALARSSSHDAIVRDAESSRAFAVLGFVAYRFDDDRDAAQRDLERAVAIDSNDAQAHHWLGVLFITQGKLEDGIAEIETAHRLQPTSEVYTRWLARAYVLTRHPDRAIAEAQQTLHIEEDDAPALLAIAAAQEERGDLQQALDTLLALQRSNPSETPYVAPDAARLEVRLHLRERVELARRIDRLAIAGQVDPFEAALFYLTIGRKERAAAMLRIAHRSFYANEIHRYDPRLAMLL
ncbi:MAG TPA: winged helix-turn-helix domain-containing protein [Candidatus Tumulicola sp.]|jgi:DNA-binding winged helix-turn-helix (wHTH) protein/Tfp pilus assembly protein PilF